MTYGKKFGMSLSSPQPLQNLPNPESSRSIASLCAAIGSKRSLDGALPQISQYSDQTPLIAEFRIRDSLNLHGSDPQI
jgi:hypothetical protein